MRQVIRTAVILTVALLISCSENPHYALYAPPEILELTADKVVVLPGDTLNLQVVISDPDPDLLTIEWDADSLGTFIGPQNAESITWQAPDSTAEFIEFVVFTVRVYDSRALESDTIQVMLADGLPAFVGGIRFDGWGTSLTAQGRIAYVGIRMASVDVFDLSNVTDPRRIGSFPSMIYDGDVQLDLPNLYVADWFKVYDATDYRSPELLSVDSVSVQEIAVSGSYVFASTYSDLVVFDVTQADDSLEAARCVDCLGFSGTASDMALDGDFLVHAGAETMMGASAAVFDISDPLFPVRIGGLGLSYAGVPRVDVEVRDDLLFCACGVLRIYELSLSGGAQLLYSTQPYSASYYAIGVPDSTRLFAAGMEYESGAWHHYVSLFDISDHENVVELSRSAIHAGGVVDACMLDEFMVLLTGEALEVVWSPEE